MNAKMHVNDQNPSYMSKKQLKNEDKPVRWKKRYGISLKIMNYREKTHFENNFSINSSKYE